MPDIVKELIIEATPQRVWRAITQQDEIVRWWAYEAQVTPEVGSLGEFRFLQGTTFTIQFEVAELDQDEKVHWISRKGAPHWTGTSVTWRLTPVQNGTQVNFSHDGFAQIDERYELTRRWWEHFLASLKSYVETGKGSPGTPDWFIKEGDALLARRAKNQPGV